MKKRNPKPRLPTKEAPSEDGRMKVSSIMETDFASKPSAEKAAAPVDASNNEILLFTRGLKKVYDGRAVVNGVDIEVRKGEIVGLLGPNGAGKTTSFYMIVGLVRPNGGKVFFDGKDATDEPMYRRARLGMGYLPQEESIFRRLTVRENILAVMETQDYSERERDRQCQQLLEKFGIDHVANNSAMTLSGGEKRRLTIARSLVTEPKLIMLDEPFSGVDPLAVEDIQKIILMLRSVGLAILITDHNVRETLGIVDRAYLIHEGQVLLHGTREYIISHPLARQNYLGENFNM
ncbi:MAG TPA: LPS export ABC transporter ATP-binding protein [Verrucomicrobiaceae bacterium]